MLTTFVLIMSLNSGFTTTETFSVRGFTSEDKCEAAGERWEEKVKKSANRGTFWFCQEQ